MAVALIEHQAGGLSFELGRKGTTLLGHQTPLYGEHSRPKWVSGISRPLQEDLGRRITALQDRLYKQFNAMDALVGRMANTSSSLLASLENLPWAASNARK